MNDPQEKLSELKKQMEALDGVGTATMNSTTETFETLWEYCISKNRLCPMPMKWNDLFGMLKNTKQNPDGGWTPPLPLILFAWDTTMPIEKQLRFKEHIQWASDNNQTEEVGKYLRFLEPVSNLLIQ